MDDAGRAGECSGARAELFDPETYETETFEPEIYEPEPFDRPYEAGMPEPEAFEQESDEAEEADRRSRLRRWAISAIWVIGIIIWFVANTFGDR